MFHDMSMLGADHSASPAPTDVSQALYADGSLSTASADPAPATAFRAAKGIWFDEGVDLRDPEGDGLTRAALDAIDAIDIRCRRRREADAANHRTIVRKILANGLRCFYHRNPPLVACQRKADSYKGKPQWLTGKSMARATSLLEEAGLIRASIGETGTASTYSVSQRLMLLASEAGITDCSLSFRLPSERLIRVYRTNSEEGCLVDFEPTEDSRRWAASLEYYNAFIAEQDIAIDLSHGETARLTARMNDRPANDLPRLTRPELIQTGLYRQFNNGSFEHGGRLYGGWWINCPKELRSRVTINGQPTIELDFSGCAIRMLYHERGLECEGDPYSLAPIAAYEVDLGRRPGHFREAVKTLTQALINGSDREKARMCDLPNGLSFAPRFTRAAVGQMIEEKHAAIADAFGSGAGLRLQRKDSDLALEIIKSMQGRGIACLPIHDSFVVNAIYEESLRERMHTIYKTMNGYYPDVK